MTGIITMEDSKICVLVAILAIAAIEISLVLTGEDGTTLVLVVAAIAGLAGFNIGLPISNKKETEPLDRENAQTP
jgi:hypothetical protein